MLTDCSQKTNTDWIVGFVLCHTDSQKGDLNNKQTIVQGEPMNILPIF